MNESAKRMRGPGDAARDWRALRVGQSGRDLIEGRVHDQYFSSVHGERIEAGKLADRTEEVHLAPLNPPTGHFFRHGSPSRTARIRDVTRGFFKGDQDRGYLYCYEVSPDDGATWYSAATSGLTTIITLAWEGWVRADHHGDFGGKPGAIWVLQRAGGHDPIGAYPTVAEALRAWDRGVR